MLFRSNLRLLKVEHEAGGSDGPAWVIVAGAWDEEGTIGDGLECATALKLAASSLNWNATPTLSGVLSAITSGAVEMLTRLAHRE